MVILVWVVASNIFYLHPYLGKIPILTNIFEMGWNHQLVVFVSYWLICPPWWVQTKSQDMLCQMQVLVYRWSLHKKASTTKSSTTKNWSTCVKSHWHDIDDNLLFSLISCQDDPNLTDFFNGKAPAAGLLGAATTIYHPAIQAMLHPSNRQRILCSMWDISRISSVGG